MKKTKDFKKLVRELEECIFNDFADTAVDVLLGSDGDSIEVYPCNGSTFHCMDEVVDFCRVFRLSYYCFIGEYKDRTVVGVRIF